MPACQHISGALAAHSISSHILSHLLMGWNAVPYVLKTRDGLVPGLSRRARPVSIRLAHKPTGLRSVHEMPRYFSRSGEDAIPMEHIIESDDDFPPIDRASIVIRPISPPSIQGEAMDETPAFSNA